MAITTPYKHKVRKLEFYNHETESSSGKDHLICKISPKKTPKEIFEPLNGLFEGSNINKRMALINQLKGVNIQKVYTMQSYFS